MPKKVVLIVEDEPDNRAIIRTVVEDIMGYEAVLAGDGEEALEIIAARAPDLILMDLMMPVLNGFDTIRLLRGRPHTTAIPIIAISALSRPRDQEQALDAGASAYISKPFDLDTLAETIAAQLSTG